MGSFWQLTDVHVDLAKECSGTAPNWYGSFNGQYGCGCSVETVNATSIFMRTKMAIPDFILFTGDATASGTILANMNVIQGSLQAQFPVTPLFLVLGNHDFPGSPVGTEADAWYQQMADMWGKRWLDAPALAELRRFGYYSTTLPLLPRVRLVALNVCTPFELAPSVVLPILMSRVCSLVAADRALQPRERSCGQRADARCGTRAPYLAQHYASVHLCRAAAGLHCWTRADWDGDRLC
jgi:hypothetical protein